MHRFLRLLSAAPTFGVAVIVFVNFAQHGASLDEIIHKNPWYFLTGVTSVVVSLFHLGLLLLSYVIDLRGWWFWRFPKFCYDEDKIRFWTYDYAWSFFWVLQLLSESLVPDDYRAFDLGATALITACYSLQTMTCVPVVYAAYNDWKEVKPAAEVDEKQQTMLSLGRLGRMYKNTTRANVTRRR